MLLATVTFTFLGNYIFTAVVVVHLINKEAVRPNPRPVITQVKKRGVMIGSQTIASPDPKTHS